MDLVILAAGMGSRFGGLKQIEPIDNDGNFIIDYTIYDAIKVGFDKVIFIIKKEKYNTFRETIGNRIEKQIKVEYVFQDMNLYLPKDVNIADRVKPWGTAHAILCAKDKVENDFVIVNADDYYGRESLRLAKDFLKNNLDKNKLVMVGYKTINTLTENGAVRRGVCNIIDGNLKCLVESSIEKVGDKIIQNPVGTEEKYFIEPNTLVSMNLFGLNKNIFDFLQNGFKEFIIANSKDLSTCEYFIPTILTKYVENKMGNIKVLNTNDKWYGLTYKQDFENVCNGINEMVEANFYPEHLWL